MHQRERADYMPFIVLVVVVVVVEFIPPAGGMAFMSLGIMFESIDMLVSMPMSIEFMSLMVSLPMVVVEVLLVVVVRLPQPATVRAAATIIVAAVALERLRIEKVSLDR